MALSEDIGRHNALDKAIGKVLLGKTAGEAGVLILTSRLSYEMVQKAARLGLEIVAGASAPTSLAISLAESVNVTLVGFLRHGGGNVYSGAQRIS
jgi:FdhD protein